MRMSLRNKSQDTHEYTINSNDLRKSETQRDLGILVHQNLTWRQQHSLVCKKSYISLNLIKRTIPANSSTNLKKQLYLSLVRSHLSYCSQLWRPMYIYQRHTKYRTCTKKSYEIHSERLYLVLQIKTIETKIVTTNALARIAEHYVSCKMSEIAPKYHCSTSIFHIK